MANLPIQSVGPVQLLPPHCSQAACTPVVIAGGAELEDELGGMELGDEDEELGKVEIEVGAAPEASP